MAKCQAFFALLGKICGMTSSTAPILGVVFLPLGKEFLPLGKMQKKQPLNGIVPAAEHSN